MSRLSLTCAGLLLSALLAPTFSPVAVAADTVRLNFGVYSSNKPSAMVRVYRPILKELEESMSRRLNRNVDIRMQIAKDYEQGISHLIKGRVDFSKFGPAPYIEAKRVNNGISVLAVENVKNSKVFYGIIAVPTDSTLSSIEELRGKSFAFGSESSTIGRFLSQLELEQAGIRADDLHHYEYLGRHDKVGTAVGAGEFDAGALNEKTFNTLVDAGVPIRELARFPNVTKPWIARSGLEDDVLQALRESLLEVKNQRTLAALKIDGFLEGDDDDYKIIRQAMDDNGLFFAKHDPMLAHGDHATTTGAEPAMQAAVASGNTALDLSNAVTIVQSTETPGSSPQDSSYLTVNIRLPRSLLEDHPKGHALTINLSIPEIGIDGAATSSSTD